MIAGACCEMRIEQVTAYITCRDHQTRWVVTAETVICCWRIANRQQCIVNGDKEYRIVNLRS